MTKLASIERVTEIIEHPNADTLEFVRTLGYKCVVPKNMFSVGDLGCLMQPDITLPQNEEWAQTYLKYAPKRVKSTKIRGEWSFGIFAPLSILNMDNKQLQEGDEVSEVLGVEKYEAPEPKDESAKGGIPFGIPKTDEERWQNLQIEDFYGTEADVTLKDDGQSCTFGYNLPTDYFFVTKRSMELKWKTKDEEGNEVKHHNNFTDHIDRYGDIEKKLRNYCKLHGVSLAIRGESYGGKIQAMKHNPRSNGKHGWVMFSVWNIGENRYERKNDPHYFLNVAKALDLPTVAVLEKNVMITKELIKKYSEDLEKINGNYFEGVVLNTDKTSFKIINLKYDSMK